MGSGIFPDEKQSSAYFKNLQVRDGTGKWDFPEGMSEFKDNRYCYDSQAVSSLVVSAFHYGGPGRSPSCM
ncbi:hypothetical protein AMTR_s00016p00054400 [Amborella trichopoda]|uniref:Neprosin PEP catalytic domain-containing protein n=1 Tax=Amborella trichopoda TaxID=13333 RepID=W1PDS5_AMBTC|nr:hypothetical protein AMTR_s00016p00054400 [Amborella trichopoda]